jgi:hypothetical protein
VSFIETRSGRRFTPLEPVVDDIDLHDIAHALSHQCRFSGHTAEHYSVAEHSVRVSELVEQWGYPRHSQLWALLHDASEAYLVDLPSPLKNAPYYASFGRALADACGIAISYGYRHAEKELMRAVCERFGISQLEPPEVRQADGVLLSTEARDLMPFKPEHWEKLAHPPLWERIYPWSHETARKNFLSRFTEVTK